MACRISELVIDAEDPGRLAAFGCDVLGYVELTREGDGSIEIGPAGAGFGGAQPTLVFHAGRDPRLGKLPLHIDVNATDRDQDAEPARLLALGAVPVDIGQTGEESWHVLADPEGNEFCLLRTRLKPVRRPATSNKAQRTGDSRGRGEVAGSLMATTTRSTPWVSSAVSSES
jgi:hypothetical protein